jgi:hypothetical protein
MTPTELKENLEIIARLENNIIKLEQLKLQAVEDKEYLEAARLRDKQNQLIKDLAVMERSTPSEITTLEGEKGLFVMNPQDEQYWELTGFISDIFRGDGFYLQPKQ